jgi:hypothetical protein
LRSPLESARHQPPLGTIAAHGGCLQISLYEEGPDVNGYSFGLTNTLEGASGDELSSLYRFLDGKTGSVGELRLVQFSQGRQMRPDL